MEKELSQLKNWLEAGHKTVIAIVRKTWGSAPRQTGSLMIIREDGTFEGSVSGGCVEGNVIAEAQNMIANNSAIKSLHFAVANDDAWAVGLACGGEIEILIINIKTKGDILPIWLTASLSAIKNRKHSQLSINLESGYITEKTHALSDTEIPSEEKHYLLPIEPKPVLFIIGAVHIAQHLCVYADEIGFRTILIDPRQGFTESRHFQSAQIIPEWPDDYFRERLIDSDSAVVALTHDPKLDDPALIPALKSTAFYIGALGSRKTHAARISRLENLGFTHKDTNRIHGPIGLNIGAKSPAEIAVSIAAELIQTYRQGQG
jgi:xanthine dehydrogenase accessory factor